MEHTGHAGSNEKRVFQRLSVNLIIQHLVLTVTFLLLVATGMPQKFPHLPYAKPLFKLLGGPEIAPVIHRICGVLSLLLTVYHFIYLLCRWISEGWNPFKNFFSRLKTGDLGLFPSAKDGKDIADKYRYFFGINKEPPALKKWAYAEKIDYLALIFGNVMIGVTGLCLFFREFVMSFMPWWWMTVCITIHSYEAFLAAVFIFTFHFYNVHFIPENFPMIKSWVTGKMTEEEVIHEHRMWYDEMMAKEKGEEGGKK
jgi:cytochrome b subunit of formate dehydrogenase